MIEINKYYLTKRSTQDLIKIVSIEKENLKVIYIGYEHIGICNLNKDFVIVKSIEGIDLLNEYLNFKIKSFNLLLLSQLKELKIKQCKN
jgi:hypothetical protein